MTNFNGAYEVPGVNLLVQDQNMACWFASAMMVLNWKEQYRPGQANQCSAIDRATIDLYKANKGIQNPQIIPLAKRLGLVPVPPMSPTIDALAGWLRTYGPLWTNGKQHIVVMAGIRRTPRGDYEVKIYDPWPGNGVGWRTLSGWYTGFDAGRYGASSRDAGADVEAVFLHAP
jgi:Papain-like cysteine protease AvrRpt2